MRHLVRLVSSFSKNLFFSFQSSDSRQFDAAGSPHPSRASLRSACRHALHDLNKRTSSFKHIHTVRDFYSFTHTSRRLQKKRGVFTIVGLFSTPLKNSVPPITLIYFISRNSFWLFPLTQTVETDLCRKKTLDYLRYIKKKRHRM